MTTTFSLEELASKLQAQLHGRPECEIFAAAPLEQATEGHVAFIEGHKYKNKLTGTRASAVLLTSEMLPYCLTNALVVKKPRLAFATLLHLLYPTKRPPAGTHAHSVVGRGCQIDPTVTLGPHAVINDHVRIGKNTVIQAGVFIGEGSEIGEDCMIYPNVSVYHGSKIGDRVTIHSGVVIGADGFGYELDSAQAWVKLLQLGRVVIGDDVEIGANTTIDRGALTDTTIGRGVKLDNQILVGHNVSIGEHTLIAGCTGIAGSVRIGRHCIIGGHVAINGHIEIADHVVITGDAMVTRSLKKPGVYSSGTAILPNHQWLKSVVRFKQLDDMHQRLQKLERESK